MKKGGPENICEERTFQTLFLDLGQRLCHFLYIRTGDRELANDLTQESFLRLWKSCAKVDLAHAKSFLYTIAHRLFLDEMKKEKVRLRFKNKTHALAVPDDPHQIAVGEELQEKIIKTINSLPEKNRTVFLLNRIEKMTYKEIAELLGISVKAVEKRMHNALLRLKEAVE